MYELEANKIIEEIVTNFVKEINAIYLKKKLEKELENGSKNRHKNKV